MRSDVTLLRAAAVCGAMILAAPAFAAGAGVGESGGAGTASDINGTATSPANGPMPSEQMDADAQNNASAAVARNNATPPYSSANSGNGITTTNQASVQAAPSADAGALSRSSGMANSSPRNLNGNAAGNTNGSLASQPPAVQ